MAATGVKAGETATFTCDYTKFAKDPTVEWFKYVSSGTDEKMSDALSKKGISIINILQFVIYSLDYKS